MTWIIVTVSLVYCFTVGLTARYKEQAVEEREKALKHHQDYQEELVQLLVQIEDKDRRIEELERQFC